MFHLPAHRLNHDLTTVPAGFAAVDFRVAANMGADGTGRDANGQGDLCAALSLLKHLVDDCNVLFFYV